MSKEAIINKIKTDAQQKADAIIAEQQEKANAILSAAQSECEQKLLDARKEIEEQEYEALSRANTVAQLDAKRLLLDARLEILDRVFDRALEKLTELDDAAMRKLLMSMLSAAEDGDEVLLNPRGKALISQKDIKAYAEKRKISLSLADGEGDFAGGLVLRQDGIDKNLTFEVELALLRSREETKIAKQIFG